MRLAALLSLLTLSGPVLAQHSADDGIKSPKDCAALPDSLRAECVKCLSDIKAHHFHPMAAAGARCQFDAGGK